MLNELDLLSLDPDHVYSFKDRLGIVVLQLVHGDNGWTIRTKLKMTEHSPVESAGNPPPKRKSEGCRGCFE